MSRNLFILSLVLITMSLSFAHKDRAKNDVKRPSIQGKRDVIDEAKPNVQKILRMAQSMVGQKTRRFSWNRRSYNADCSGFLSYLFARQNISLIDSSLARGERNMTKIIYKTMHSRKLTHKRKIPKVGDLVFFHNTFDRNRDRRENDPFTHIGIVERIDGGGTMQFIHYINPRFGVRRDKMNLLHPRDRTKNSYIRSRRRYPSPTGKYLTGELFAGFASPY